MNYKNIADTFTKNLLNAVIVEELNNSSLNINSKSHEFLEEVKKLESSGLIKNVLCSQAVVLIISAMETYFRDTFILLANHRKDLKEMLKDRGKIEFYKVFDMVIEKQLTFGHLLADEFNFQNFSQICSAFGWLGLDIKKYMKEIEAYSRRKDIKCKSCGGITVFPIVQNSIKQVEDILNLRHRIVHESYIDSNAKYNFILANFLIPEFVFIVHDFTCHVLNLKNIRIASYTDSGEAFEYNKKLKLMQ